ncbi:hypothetical protein C942_04113 [Photobacterium marinum]|uniref:RiboL-PSP-HEPN domain-containing protein n=1 Tax=Photobacterium marinum TaxID=1056511 RepID=L8J647_9GAMM|nr:hypothetical protein [Photobacterium marinum]ELR63099.1 hypothetical protein C942_04113 [Photobacterium marinum]
MQMDISFECDCGEVIKTIVGVPMPNFEAEKNRDSATEHYEEILCDECGKENEVMVVNTFFAADCYVNNGDNEVNYGMPYFPEDDYDDWYESNKTQYEIFNDHIKSIESLLEVQVESSVQFSLLVMLYGHIVAAVEGYLAATFIHKVINSEELIKKLVETDPTFSKRTFSLKEIFEKQSALKTTVADYLKELIFHDLKKIKPMYLSVLGHDFENISWLFQAVKVRHDCVHRAGFDKEGNQIVVDEDVIRELVAKCTEMVTSVEETVSKISEPDDLPF